MKEILIEWGKIELAAVTLFEKFSDEVESDIFAKSPKLRQDGLSLLKICSEKKSSTFSIQRTN